MYRQIYPKGSKVRIKRTLNRKEKYPGRNGSSNPGVNEDMMTLRGSIVTIRKMNHNGHYSIEEDYGSWSWTDSMFEHNSFNTLLNN